MCVLLAQFITLFPMKLHSCCCMQTFSFGWGIYIKLKHYVIGSHCNSRGHLHLCQDYIRLLWLRAGGITNALNAIYIYLFFHQHLIFLTLSYNSISCLFWHKGFYSQRLKSRQTAIWFCIFHISYRNRRLGRDLSQ